MPGQALTIEGKMLHNRYAISSNYGIRDLERVVEIGFWEKIYNSERYLITLEKSIKFKIKHTI